MTTEHEATRTLVKSPPELWAECSDAASLARHLGEFGEIEITRLDPETAVAWEGERASGTVRIEPSGWGTRVTLTAETPGDAQMRYDAQASDNEVEEPLTAQAVSAAEPAVAASVMEPREADTPSTAEEEVDAAPRVGLMARLRTFFRPKRTTEVAVADPRGPELRESQPQPESVTPKIEPEPVPDPPKADPTAVLAAALDSLGQAHHRPFSRG
jgi:hypothetical protein